MKHHTVRLIVTVMVRKARFGQSEASGRYIGVFFFQPIILLSTNHGWVGNRSIGLYKNTNTIGAIICGHGRSLRYNVHGRQRRILIHDDLFGFFPLSTHQFRPFRRHSGIGFLKHTNRFVFVFFSEKRGGGGSFTNWFVFVFFSEIRGGEEVSPKKPERSCCCCSCCCGCWSSCKSATIIGWEPLSIMLLTENANNETRPHKAKNTVQKVILVRQFWFFQFLAVVVVQSSLAGCSTCMLIISR